MAISTSTAKHVFYEQFSSEPALVARAPGRVNLIGEHTDYNDGFVFPVALDFEVKIVAAPRGDTHVCLYSDSYRQRDAFNLQTFEKSEDAPWSNFVRGVIREFHLLGHHVGGFNAVILGDVPLGSGLSSSAAIEVATATMLSKLFDIPIDPKEIALLCQRAENRFIGVSCGIMDQFISALGAESHALFIDCRSLGYELVPLQLHGYSLVICNSNAPRELASSAYNERLGECREGTAMLKQHLPEITALRDVCLHDFTELQEILPKTIRRRCRHVVTENERTLQAVHELQKGNLERFGQLMNESHDSLRDDYEVSSPYLDTLVDLAREGEECLGSRLTGAGFGGCTVSLVKNEGVEAFIHRVSKGYEERTGKHTDIYVSSARNGAAAEFFKTVPVL